MCEINDLLNVCTEQWGHLILKLWNNLKKLMKTVYDKTLYTLRNKIYWF